jgi:phosphatidylserine/phosphatidylglycerophosphate/cardiolipin synthase-like enzyme
MKDYVPFANVNVWLHISFIHSKILYIDRIATSIGSFNIHHNATDHSYESTIVALDAELNRQIDQAMIFDMANSNPLIYKNIIENK